MGSLKEMGWANLLRRNQSNPFFFPPAVTVQMPIQRATCFKENVDVFNLIFALQIRNTESSQVLFEVKCEGCRIICLSL